MSKLDELRRSSPREALRLVWRKAVYRRVVMGRWGYRAGDSKGPERPCSYPIEIWGPDRYRTVLGTNEHLSADDLDHFDRQESSCIVVLDGDAIAASSWMTRGSVFVHELHRPLDVADGQHFSCRSYVSPDYRGHGLLSHMLNTYASEVPADDEIWGLVYYWNEASVRSLENIGWHLSGEYWTTFLFGRKRPGHRRFAPQPPGGKPPPRR